MVWSFIGPCFLYFAQDMYECPCLQHVTKFIRQRSFQYHAILLKYLIHLLSVFFFFLFICLGKSEGTAVLLSAAKHLL